jgi:mannose-1-phosphate guanylyltransferase
MYYAVIMAGGSGTRLWPLSRKEYPKQALKLFGEKTMFQHTVDRITPIYPPERILVVTSPKYAEILQKQCPGIPNENFILEPEGRGTASAIGLVAIHLLKRDPDAGMVILTADHYITAAKHFCEVLRNAEFISKQGNLVTLGIQPSCPSTGFGYIHQGALLGKREELNYYSVKSFIEKPVMEKAKEMIHTGDYSWNSGMFIWQVSQILSEFKNQMPDLYSTLMEIEAVIGTSTYHEVLGKLWSRINKNTIDYGIMENAKNVVVIPVNIGWTDIGSWESLFKLYPGDINNNTFIGNHISIDTENTLTFGKKRLIAMMGINNLIIIDTDDVVMVCSREREQDVKSFITSLQETEKTEYI